jgi:hypothetical protein
MQTVRTEIAGLETRLIKLGISTLVGTATLTGTMLFAALHLWPPH